MSEPIDTVVVTRHAGTIQYLILCGLIPVDDRGIPTCEIVAHATLEDVRGRNVIGMLPYNLAAEAASVTVVDMNIPAELRGIDLDADQVAQYATGTSIYVVKRIDQA